MGRLIVIISLAMAQCTDITAAAPSATGIPLPKPRPARQPPPPKDRTVAAPANIRAAAEVDTGDAPADERRIQISPAQTHPDEESPADASRERMPEAQAFANPPYRLTAPVKSSRTDGNCNGGRRVMSAYYWEGKRTASGQPFNPRGLTAAHRTLPFGTRLTVSNPRTGKSVIVVVNDRGPFVSGISLDLSLGAAQAIGMRGTGAVCIE
jgi:rare lipoprotein A